MLLKGGEFKVKNKVVLDKWFYPYLTNEDKKLNIRIDNAKVFQKKFGSISLVKRLEARKSCSCRIEASRFVHRLIQIVQL